MKVLLFSTSQSSWETGITGIKIAASYRSTPLSMTDDTCNHTRLTSIVTSSIELCTGIIGIKITDSYLVSQHTPIYLYDGSFCVLKLFYCWIGGVVVLSWIILDQIFWWEWKLKWCQKIFAMQTPCRFRNTDITFHTVQYFFRWRAVVKSILFDLSFERSYISVELNQSIPTNPISTSCPPA